MNDSFWTVQRHARVEVKVRGSRFLADVYPVKERASAEKEIENARRTMHDATHHCFAYRLGADGAIYRMHDDGEPSGTAGRPLRAAIDRAGLTDTLVIVTRYYGGTKLGVGGLARAYGEAAERGIREAGRRECTVVVRLAVGIPHALVNTVMHLVSRYQARVVETSYDEQARMVLEVRSSTASDMTRDIVEKSRGAATVTSVEAPRNTGVNSSARR